MSKPNRLAHEASLYLLQHANNPVDWYPWGDAALNKAKREKKPILLSIGYSACHWCHVMARESFEDPATALLMNEWFVCIKVDREERPDLDKIYQTVHQLLTGKPGGWPLTIFLTPDQLAFYSGTYFPKQASFGRLTFKAVLEQLTNFYHEQPDAIASLTHKVQMALTALSNRTLEEEKILNEQPLINAREELEKTFDFEQGGFYSAPKFPLTTHLQNLWLHWYSSGGKDQEACNMVDFTLKQMAKGGIYDQIGGGFFRYSTDAHWIIPHFEKMLYDNAQLVPLYAEVAAISDDRYLKSKAEETIEWTLREMSSPLGGFYATINADSEGVEGKFYYWGREEIRSILTNTEYSGFAPYFSVDKSPNFGDHWHLYCTEVDFSQEFHLASAKQKLYNTRQKRIPPSCDKKILTSWNSLMVKALIVAGLNLNRQDFIQKAHDVLKFIHSHLWDNNHLLAFYNEGRKSSFAFLDDYAFLLEALWYFLQAQWSEENLQWMKQLADQMCELFYDAKQGGFFFTANDHESLIQRPKLFFDEALPSGNGIAALCLLNIGNLLGDTSYLLAAEKTLQAGWPHLMQQASACGSFLLALRSFLQPNVVIILRGDSAQMTCWQQEWAKFHLLDHSCFAIPSNGVSNFAAVQKPIPERGVWAYFCQGQRCYQVIKEFDEFNNYLMSRSLPFPG